MVPLFLTDTADVVQPTMADLLMPLLTFVLPLVIIVYFMIIRPEKKRKKKEAQMLEELIVGVEVTTRGGIIGRIVNIKDDTITLETGADKCRIKMLRSSISTVNTQISD